MIFLSLLGGSGFGAETNATTTANFTELSRWPEYPRGPGQSLEVVGNTAYVAAGTAGLVVFDLTDELNPRRSGGLDTPGFCSFVTVAGNYAFLIDGREGLLIVDVSVPSTPRLVGSYPNPPGTGPDSRPKRHHSVAVQGNRAYLTSTDSLLILDITDPRIPAPLSSFALPATIFSRELTVAGNKLYLAARNAGLLIIDVSDSLAPRLLGTYTRLNADVRYVDLYGSFAVISHWDFLQVIDVSNPATPTPVGQYVPGFTIVGLKIVGDLAVLGLWRNLEYLPKSNIAILSVADITAPALIFRYPVPHVPTSVVATSDRVYATDTAGKLHTVSLSSSGEFTPRAKFSIGGYARQVVVSGEFAYLCDGDLQIFSLANPERPVRVGTYPDVSEFAITGNLACVVDDIWFRVVDLSDKANPRTISSYALPNVAGSGYHRVVVVGNRALAAAHMDAEGIGGDFLHVFDISAPAELKEPAKYFAGVSNIDVYASDKHAYYPASRGVLLFSGDPAAEPLSLQSWVPFAPSRGTFFSGNYQFSAGVSHVNQTNQAWLRVLDITDPLNPLRLGTGDIPGARSIISGQFGLIQNQLFIPTDRGLEFMNVSDPAMPQWTGTYSDEGEPMAAAAASGLLYLADGSAGLKVLRPRFGLPQEITFNPPLEISTSAPPVSLTATASSGLPVSFSVVSGPAVITDTALTITGPGPVRLRAEQPGNEEFLSITREVIINAPEPVRLTIKRMGAEIELSWRSDFGEFVLQRSSALGDEAHWVNIIAPLDTASAEKRLRLSPAGGTLYFRLVWPGLND